MALSGNDVPVGTNDQMTSDGGGGSGYHDRIQAEQL